MNFIQTLKQIITESYKQPTIKLEKGETLEIEKGLFKTKIKITKN